jgi:hypothetical protein
MTACAAQSGSGGSGPTQWDGSVSGDPARTADVAPDDGPFRADAAGNGSNDAAATAAPFSAPKLVNPVSPLDHGARCDGVTDDTAAFQAAVTKSDVLVPKLTCVINREVQITMSNRHIECEPGALLKQTSESAGTMFRVHSSGALTGDSIVNCMFLGTNTVAPRYTNTLPKHYNIPIQTMDRVSNFFLAGNTFTRFWGQSMFQTYGTTDGGTGDVIVNNTFKSCGYYGPVLVAHRNGYIGHNTLVDCATGIENDNGAQNSGGNIVEYNTLTAVHGYGAPDMNASVMVTGGVAGKADYSTNIVRYNTVSGTSDSQGAHPGKPSMIIEMAPGGAPRYISNTCGDGCKVEILR